MFTPSSQAAWVQEQCTVRSWSRRHLAQEAGLSRGTVDSLFVNDTYTGKTLRRISAAFARHPAEVSIPGLLYETAHRQNWSVSAMDTALRAKLKPVEERTSKDWTDLVAIMSTYPNLFLSRSARSPQ